jgi:hypothetical protein
MHDKFAFGVAAFDGRQCVACLVESVNLPVGYAQRPGGEQVRDLDQRRAGLVSNPE